MQSHHNLKLNPFSPQTFFVFHSKFLCISVSNMFVLFDSRRSFVHLDFLRIAIFAIPSPFSSSALHVVESFQICSSSLLWNSLEQKAKDAKPPSYFMLYLMSKRSQLSSWLQSTWLYPWGKEGRWAGQWPVYFQLDHGQSLHFQNEQAESLQRRRMLKVKCLSWCWVTF